MVDSSVMTHTARSPWVQWSGGECPVGTDTHVTVIFRRMLGDAPDSATGPSGDMLWQHGLANSDDEIVAYRISEV